MTDVPDDQVPEYDESDAEGDRQPFLDDPDYVNIEELFPDEAP